MLVLKLMGLMDFASALFLLMEHLMISPPFFRPLLGFAVYLFGKAYTFRGDFASLLDLFCGIYIIFAFFGLKTFLAYFVIIYLIQKAAMSFIC